MKTNEIKLPETENLNQNCFWKLDLYSGLLSWSDGLCALLGLQKPCTPTLEQLMGYYLPEQNIRPAFKRAIHQGIPFELELPAVLASGKVMMVCTTANAVYDDYGKCVAIKGVLYENENNASPSKSTTHISENAEEMHIMLENFARVISHNLRSHTSNLQMVLESIHQKTSSKEMRGVLGDIKIISTNLNQTVGYLNTLIKI